MKRKPSKLERNIPKKQIMNEDVFFRVLDKTAPDYKVKDFLREWGKMKNDACKKNL